MLRHCMKDRGRVIRQVDRNQENSEDLEKPRVSRITVINQGSKHRNQKRPTPKPKPGIKRAIPSSVSSRNYKYRRPNNPSQESHSIAGPSHQQDSRQDKSPTVASRHEGSGQYNKARESKTTKNGTKMAAERRTVRSKQTTAVRPCPYYLRSRVRQPEGIPEERRNSGIASIPKNNIRRRSINMEALETEIQWIGADKGQRIIAVPIGLTWEHDILVLKPSPCLHNGNEVDDYMGLDEWNSWFKSQFRDSNRSQGRVENEMDRLEREGIIEKVESSERATPVVSVAKTDGSVRLRADYSVTLNPNLIALQHPLPRLKEILGSLNGGKQFPKLGFKHACFQMKVHPENELFQGMDGVKVFMDDARITGSDEMSPLTALNEFFKMKVAIFGSKGGLPALTATRRLHYALILQSFQFDIVFRKTNEHGDANFLSRLPKTSEELEVKDGITIFQMSQLETLPLTSKELQQ
ncbi:uncharacterized protein K02A2.6 [Trichonephila clavipes]|uniref:Uncharacterized protein K02A2.6 n=1 Tax=Trichonephila clavipes TaxID=2585209 RepID=A0A8X6S7D8_TRICX|nr:uncharacterized protein K02A2.6 [Trichonephila clavipes]